MIITETVIIDGNELIHTYSDANRYITCGDDVYEDAYDPAFMGRVYTEGDLIVSDEDDEYAEAGRILLGEEDDGQN